MKQKGFSLIMALVALVFMMLLGMVSLMSVTSDSRLSGGIYSRAVGMSAAESALHQAAPVVLRDGRESNLNTLLAINQGVVFDANHDNTIAYTYGGATFEVNIRDDDEDDDNDLIDSNGIAILSATGRSSNGGEATIEVLVRYPLKEYAQEGGGSKGQGAQLL